MKPIFCFVLSCCISLHSFCQVKAPTENTLLWRISGKGLSKPSYLYGTMHLTDDRLFNFSDSLLIAIEKSEGFAIELDPDEMMTVVMQEMFDDELKSPLLKDVVSKKAFSKYGPKLSKRIKKDQDEITVKDVLHEQNKWMQDAYSKGPMPTFVDIWLYDIARRQGKWVGGIEDVQDQAGLIDDLFNEQDLAFLTVDYDAYGKKFLNEMIDSYSKQDINKMEAMSTGGDAHVKDLLLLRRNVKMARRMDSLSAIRTMVFAVGAAHLAGDSGVISLLRQRGFEVEPVYSSKKIAGKNYKVAEKSIPWQKAADSKGFYEVEMPGKASPLKMYGLLEMRIHINLFSSSGYMMMALPTSYNTQNADSLLLAMARSIMENEKVKQGKPIVKNGIFGREYIGKGRGGYERIQAFTNGQVIYVAVAFFTKEDQLNQSDANRFFDSLVLFDQSKVDNSWTTFTNMLPGLQGAAPVALEPNKEMLSQMAQEKGFDTKLYTGMDAVSGGLYMLIAKSTIDDSYIPDDSSFLNTIRENGRLKFEKMDLDTLLVQNDVYSLEQKGLYKEQPLYFHGKSYVLGNRMYSLFAIIADNEKSKGTAAKVIETFRVNKLAGSTWSAQPIGNNHFSTWAPNRFTHAEYDTVKPGKTLLPVYNAKDTNSSYTYTIIRNVFDSSTWYNSEDAYWKEKLDDVGDSDDSIINKQAFKVNGLQGYDIELKNKGGSNKVKMLRMFTYGDTLYTLFTYVPDTEKNNADIRRFFTDIKFSKPAPAATVFKSRSMEFLNKFSITDSAVLANSYELFYKANFSKEDIPILRQALLKHYGWDTASYHYSNMQVKIGEKLVALGDSSLDDFVKTNYSIINGRDEEEQTSLLRYVVQKTSSDNMRFTLDALKTIDDTAVINESCMYYLNDSMPLLQHFAPQVLELISKKNMTYAMLSISVSMLDSNIILPNAILPYENVIIDFGKTKLAELDAEEESSGWPLSSTALVAGRLKTKNLIALLREMCNSRHNEVKHEGVIGLLEAKEEISESVLTSIAADVALRGELLRTLSGKGKEDLFPKKFKTQQLLGESVVYDFATDDDDPPSSISFVTTRKSTLKGSSVIVYVYKLTYVYDGEEEWHIAGVAYPSDAKNLESIMYSTELLWDDTYDGNKKEQERQVKELLDQIRKNVEED